MRELDKTGTGAGETAATRTSARATISDAVVKCLAWLDLSDVQHRFVTGVGAAASPRETGRVSLEYRRFLLLRLAYPELDVPAPPLIDSYWRVHAADRPRFVRDCASLTRDTKVSPEALEPPLRPTERAASPEIRDLYQVTFPCGSADLWGWPQLKGHRHSAPALGSVHIRLASAIDELTRTRLRKEAFEQRQQAKHEHSTGSDIDEMGGSVYSGGRYQHASPGPILRKLHWDGTIPRLIADRPVRSSRHARWATSTTARGDSSESTPTNTATSSPC